MSPRVCGGGASGGGDIVGAGKRFTKSMINWKEMRDKVPPNQMAQFQVFKAKSDNYLRRVNSQPPIPPRIDWEYYKKMVPIEGLVDRFKKDYEAFKAPYPEDTLTKSIDAQWDKIKNDIKIFKDEQAKCIDAASKEIARINAVPNYEDMTMEMYANHYPSEAPNFVEKPTFWPHDNDELKIYKPKF